MHDREWLAERQLAHGLLGYLKETLAVYDVSWQDLQGIGVFEGPGSFTGLRIGMTVCNTLADSLGVPIVGARGDNWQQDCLNRLASGENDSIVLPFYGAEANITKPRK
jgi:tRNA threonylcarbamoyladenosine biosynthesis protein TsaB